jgi:hypothetical protein
LKREERRNGFRQSRCNRSTIVASAPLPTVRTVTQTPPRHLQAKTTHPSPSARRFRLLFNGLGTSELRRMFLQLSAAAGEIGNEKRSAPVCGIQDAIAQRSSPGLASNRSTVKPLSRCATPAWCKPTHPSPSARQFRLPFNGLAPSELRRMVSPKRAHPSTTLGTVARKVSATTGPTPGVVIISLRQTSSWRTISSSWR